MAASSTNSSAVICVKFYNDIGLIDAGRLELRNTIESKSLSCGDWIKTSVTVYRFSGDNSGESALYALRYFICNFYIQRLQDIIRRQLAQLLPSRKKNKEHQR